MDAKLVRELREITGVQILKCRKALEECDGDVQKAAEWLRRQDPKASIKDRAVGEGAIGTYVHNGQIGVMVEILCETDFVARNDDFKELLNDLCLHIAASNPIAVHREDVAAERVQKEREIFEEQVKDKPDNIAEKIVSGKLDKWFATHCLMEQRFVKNDKQTVGELVNQRMSKLSENLVVRRFVRWQLGEK